MPPRESTLTGATTPPADPGHSRQPPAEAPGSSRGRQEDPGSGDPRPARPGPSFPPPGLALLSREGGSRAVPAEGGLSAGPRRAPGGEVPAGGDPGAPKYLVVEGPIGVGKSGLARLLAESFRARLVLEPTSENPFLEQFYRDRRKYAFQTQLFFLTSRYQQQQELAQPDLFRRTTVADYLFAKDRIFAYLNLDDTELAMYEKIYRMVEPMVLRPDLVVYLQASAEVLRERIRRRNRPAERYLEPQYLEELVQAYNNYFFHYADSPLLVVNTTDVDFVNDSDDYADLLREIRGMGRGTQYYVPRRRG